MNEKNRRREYFEEIPSTNDYAKAKRNEKRNLLVVAKQQSGGRGTKGRSFSSCEGGLYLSLLTFYQNFPAKNAFQIMQNAAAAVCETLSSIGLQSTIKWPNDIYVGGKKICGILIENEFSGNVVCSSVVGIGINVYNDLSGLEDIATSIRLCTGNKFDVQQIENALLGYIDKGVADKYQNYLGWINQTVCLETAEKQVVARFIGVDAQGNLLAEVDGEQRCFSSAEVRLAKEGL